MIGLMPRFRAPRAAVPLLLLLALAGAALAAACTGGGGGDAPAATPEPTAVATATETATPAAATPTPESYSFPTGPAVLVTADYEAPEDRVASTGAYIPSNGKPTLVFVDAIW